MQKVKGSHRKASSVCPRPGCDAPISSQGLCQHHCDELNKQQAEIAARRTGGGFFNYKQPPPRCEEKMPRKPDEEMPRAMRAAAEKKPRGNEDMPRSMRAEPTWRDRERKQRMVEADWRETLDDLEKALRGVRRPYILGPLADYKALHRRLLGFLSDGDNVIADVRQWLDGEPIPEGRRLALVVDNSPRKPKRVRLKAKPYRVRLRDDDDPPEAA